MKATCAKKHTPKRRLALKDDRFSLFFCFLFLLFLLCTGACAYFSLSSILYNRVAPFLVPLKFYRLKL